MMEEDLGSMWEEDWEAKYPGHCYICHVASENAECGPHCEEQT